jgi:outer membrane protein OmpA-like peptidoglycan-associated protein
MVDGSEPEAGQINGSINTKYHEGLVSFSPDGNTMYFSRESFYEGVYEKDEENNTKISVIHLFAAQKNGDKWGNVEALPFNGDSYSVKNPSVSADGKTLYFASDMPGTVGKFDIFKTEIKGDGSFGEPTNLGDKINTKEQEMFPFISDDNILYFSSTGHLGLGGLDVFLVDKDGSIKNIGIPVNSNYDDLAFSINEETGRGFVSSNREGGKGNDDIYAIKRLEPCEVMLITTVIDAKTSSPISGATVTISDSSGRILFTQTSGGNGEVTYTVGCDKPLEVYGQFLDYESNSITFSGSKKDEEEIQLMLSPIDEIIQEDRVVLNPILFEFDKSNITPQGAFELDKLVEVMKKYPDMVILAESHTDNRGSKNYNEQLSDRRAKSTVQYVISKGIDASRISGIGKGENELKVDCGSKCTDEDHQANRRSEFIIISGNPSQN